MKEVCESQFDALEAIFNSKIVIFFLKRLLLAFLPLSMILFIASRIPVPFVMYIVEILGITWAYFVIQVSIGAICRCIYTGCIKSKTLDLKSCISFSRGFIPAYLLGPFVIAILSLVLIISCFLLISIGLIPYIGEIILGIIILPILIICIIYFVLSILLIYFTPAIIATEDEGLTYVLKRMISLFHHFRGRLLMYFLLAVLFIGILTSFFAGASALIYGWIFTTAAAILKTKLANLIFVAGGHFAPNFALYSGNIPFTFQVAAFLFYFAGGASLALLFTIPGVFICSSSVYLYNTIKLKENEGILSQCPGKDREPADSSFAICPHCDGKVKSMFKFCTLCGKILKTDEK